MADQASSMKTGRVLIRAGFGHLPGTPRNGWRYESVRVRLDEDGVARYFHGGPTCNTADGWVTLPEDYLDQVVWD